MLQVYTGNGKGKSTAAFGLALRAAGQGLRVRIVQFCKNGGCGEHHSFQKLGVPVYTGEAVEEPPWNPGAKEKWSRHSKAQFALAVGLLGDCDVLVLDELLGAHHAGYIDEAQMKGLIAARPEELELVLTGRNAPPFVVEAADLVTEMRCVKHYYEAGVSARCGIEY